MVCIKDHVLPIHKTKATTNYLILLLKGCLNKVSQAAVVKPLPLVGGTSIEDFISTNLDDRTPQISTTSIPYICLYEESFLNKQAVILNKKQLTIKRHCN